MNNMKKQIKKISIGIAAFNEEANIAYLLKSINSQNQNNIKIIEIILASDGSTDNTVSVAKKSKTPNLKVLNDGKRLGKASRINQLIKNYKGDYIVLFDADVVLENKNTLEKLISSFNEGSKVGIVCGNPIPLPAKTFIGKSANNLFIADNYIRNNFKSGHNIFSALGVMMALNKKFTKKIKLPKTTQGDDMFFYLSCITSGFEYRRNIKAGVFFRTPQSIKDFIKQSSRHMNAYGEYEHYFDRSLVLNEMTVPFRYKIHVPLYQARKNPLGWIFLKTLSIIGRQIGEKKQNLGIWDSVRSTKVLF